MSSEISPWNSLQFIVICTFTCYLSFFQAPEGGLTVVALYVSLIALATPAVFVQLKVGGYLQKGVVGVFSMFFPIWKGVGVAALFDLFLIISTTAPMVAQLGTYSFIAISSHPYRWAVCNTVKPLVWDHEMCGDPLGEGMSAAVGRTTFRPEEIFYKREFLQLSRGIDSVDGFPQWRFTDLARKAEVSLMPVTLSIVWVLVSLFVGFGPRICGWILFLLGPAALSCLLAVLGYGYHNLDSDHAVTYLRSLYLFREEEGNILLKWIIGFKLLIYTLPVWTAICCTMGKFCGRSRKIRNLTWVMMLAVFLLVSQVPNLAMAPFLGNLAHTQGSSFPYGRGGLERLMWQMPAAFTELKVPPAYAFVFYLSAFLFTLMFLCIGTLTIVDNIMDALSGWIARLACSKIAVHLLVTFCIMLLAQGMGIIQTTKAGHYYYILIEQSLHKLRFLHIILLAFGLMVVYVRQNFGLIEKVTIGLWFCLSSIASSCLFVYYLYDQLENYSSNILYDALSAPVSGYFPPEWTLVSWAIAGFPFIGVLLGAIHSCFSSCKSPSQKCTKLCCGMTERVREHNGDHFEPPPLLPPEPSAPPYMYSYMESVGNGGGSRGDNYHLDHYKLDYDPPEAEPLTLNDRSTRI